jgi:hypothetical protein
MMVKMTKEIPLSRGLKALVDDEDYEELSKYDWCAMKPGSYCYAARGVYKADEKHIIVWMHRQILNTPDDMQTDHINGDTLDNRRCNIRVCTKNQNNFNRSKALKPASSKYKGVYWSNIRKRWCSRIQKDGKTYWNGSFRDEKDAALAYNDKATELFGEFARLNEVD